MKANLPIFRLTAPRLVNLCALLAFLLGIGLLLIAGASFGAQTPATGLQHLTFTQRSPLSARDIVLARVDMTNQPTGGAGIGNYSLANEPFTAVVPRGYDPKVPHGLLVWTGVSPFSEAWLDVLARHRLILVFADGAIGHASQYGLHLDAVYNMEQLYGIDASRVYVSGFSAGGALAKHLVCAFPEVFRGGLFLMGGYFYLSRNVGNGQREPTVEQCYPSWKGPLEQIKQNTRLVIMKGGSDPEWTPQEGRSDYRALWLDGFTRASYFEVPRLKHMHPDVWWFERGITALDQSTPLVPPAITPTKDAHPLPGQIAQAQRILATGRYYIEAKMPPIAKAQMAKVRKANLAKARKYLEQLMDEYPTTPAAATARTILAGVAQKEEEK
jgi:predicted esterase